MFLFESPEFSTSDRHKIDDKYVFCMTLMKIYEIFSFWHFRGFHGQIFLFFSRPHSSFSRVGFGRKFHGDCWFFTGSFQEFFTGRIFFFTGGNPKNFTGGNFFFTGKKIYTDYFCFNRILEKLVNTNLQFKYLFVCWVLEKKGTYQNNLVACFTDGRRGTGSRYFRKTPFSARAF